MPTDSKTTDDPLSRVIDIETMKIALLAEIRRRQSLEFLVLQVCERLDKLEGHETNPNFPSGGGETL